MTDKLLNRIVFLPLKFKRVCVCPSDFSTIQHTKYLKLQSILTRWASDSMVFSVAQMLVLVMQTHLQGSHKLFLFQITSFMDALQLSPNPSSFFLRKYLHTFISCPFGAHPFSSISRICWFGKVSRNHSELCLYMYWLLSFWICQSIIFWIVDACISCFSLTVLFHQISNTTVCRISPTFSAAVQRHLLPDNQLYGAFPHTENEILMRRWTIVTRRVGWKSWPSFGCEGTCFYATGCRTLREAPGQPPWKVLRTMNLPFQLHPRLEVHCLTTVLWLEAQWAE